MRNCNYIGNPSMFQSRVNGVGSQRPFTQSELVDLCKRGSMYCPDTVRASVCHPDSPAGTCQPVDWDPGDDEKRLKEAQSWRSNTPIASWTAMSPSGEPREIKVYGYNKAIGYVWLAEGPNASAANSQLYPEFVLASKSPEWVALKESLGTSKSALPLLIGAAFLLLS